MEAEAFLRLALRARRDPAARDELPLVLAGLDWEAVLALAIAERLAPLLYAGVKSLPLPGEVGGRLRAIYYESARLSVVRLSQLERVLAVFSARQVEVILLKGAALAEPVYGSAALRPMADLDLLVRPAQVEAACAALAELGYTRTQIETRPGAILDEENVLQFALAGQVNSLVEIHWGLLHPPDYQERLAEEWLWQGRQPVRVGEQPAQVLGAEALLLHLCAHLCLHHQGQGLLWLNDIAEVLACYAGQLDWDLLQREAARNELVCVLQWALPRAANLGGPVPAGRLAQLAGLRPGWRERRAFARGMRAQASGAHATLGVLAGMRGMRAARYLLSSLFPSASYMRERYHIRHALLLPLYYPWRWISGLRRR